MNQGLVIRWSHFHISSSDAGDRHSKEARRANGRTTIPSCPSTAQGDALSLSACEIANNHSEHAKTDNNDTVIK